MSQGNNIGWGAIYSRSYWGNGVEDNTISWGIAYRESAGDSTLVDRYVSRVEADGGVVESADCASRALKPNGNWDYYFRVVDDGGSVEAFDCLENV